MFGPKVRVWSESQCLIRKSTFGQKVNVWSDGLGWSVHSWSGLGGLFIFGLFCWGLDLAGDSDRLRSESPLYSVQVVNN